MLRGQDNQFNWLAVAFSVVVSVCCQNAICVDPKVDTENRISIKHAPARSQGPAKSGMRVTDPKLVHRENQIFLVVSVNRPGPDGVPIARQEVLDIGPANLQALEKILDAAKSGNRTYSLPDAHSEDHLALEMTGKVAITVDDQLRVTSIEVEGKYLTGQPDLRWERLSSVRSELEVRLPSQFPRPLAVTAGGERIGDAVYFPPIDSLDKPFIIQSSTRYAVADLFIHLTRAIPPSAWGITGENKVELRYPELFEQAKSATVYSQAGGPKSPSWLVATLSPPREEPPARKRPFSQSAIALVRKLPEGAEELGIQADVMIKRGYDDYEPMALPGDPGGPLFYRRADGRFVVRFAVPGEEIPREVLLSEEDTKKLKPYIEARLDGKQVWLNTGKGMMKFDDLIELTVDEEGKTLSMRNRFWSGVVPDRQADRQASPNERPVRDPRMEKSHRYFGTGRVAAFIETREGASQAAPATVKMDGKRYFALLVPAADDSSRAVLKVIWSNSVGNPQEATYLVAGDEVDYAIKKHYHAGDAIEIEMADHNRPLSIRVGDSKAEPFDLFEFKDHGYAEGQWVGEESSSGKPLSFQAKKDLWKTASEVKNSEVRQAANGSNRCSAYFKRMGDDEIQSD
jgi:hypothetical protein